VPDGKGLCNGIYEPIHGSAPDIAGQGVINPVAAILSVAMLLLYSLNMPRESVLVEQAVRIVIDQGIMTKDIGGSNSTVEVGDAVAKELESLFQQ
jgi:3-isopropylmalate dehydrogenase